MSNAIKKNWGWVLLAGILTTAATLFILNVSQSEAGQATSKGDGCCTTCVCSKDGGKCCNGVTDGKCCTDANCCCNNGTCKCGGNCCGNKSCASGMKAGAAHHGCSMGKKAGGASGCGMKKHGAMKSGCPMKTDAASTHGTKSCCKDKGAAPATTATPPSGQTTAPATDGTSIK